MQKLGSDFTTRIDKFQCTDPVFIGVLCSNNHNSSFPSRCRKCKNCVVQYRRVLYAKFYYKLDKYFEKFGRKPSMFFWTLGTDLEDTIEGRLQLKEYWKLFRHRMKNFTNNYGWYTKKYDNLSEYLIDLVRGNTGKVKVLFTWKALFYVVEAGSLGGRLHFHILVDTYADHSVVIHHWRDITGTLANVNFTEKRDYMTNEKALNYMLKYITKQRGRYYWLGEFHKIKFAAYARDAPRCLRTQYVNLYTEYSCNDSDLIYTWDVNSKERMDRLLPIVDNAYSLLKHMRNGYIQPSLTDY